ncbi:MAG: cyclic nucleotide-binding domain-containing protein [Pseudomonadota bacterium]|uniref:Cyclic nucleotide-binding domain-containing protein n=1 Tax=Caldimonas aquatica TaxID=376175 RepID=A0ABY6MS98_9BURK|nr:cyclic nucleotide-binding domain-containing protein [Schlegelella aquatica]UZD54893.1 cyclic nucleotide-binding domain-containing protein [Schlegelella aquatica]
MKKLIDKLKGAPAGSDQEEGAEDSGFFSTMFQERTDDTQLVTTWRARAQEVGAQPYDRRKGAERFAELWGADRYVASLGRAELERMSQYLDFVQVPPGQEIIGQDEQGDYMLIVLEGTVAVDRVQPWGGRARLAEARPGDMLGEMSLLDAGARFSACKTLTPCVLAVLDAEGLDRMIMQEPRLGLALLASLARRLSLRLRQVSARLSALLSRA